MPPGMPAGIRASTVSFCPRHKARDFTQAEQLQVSADEDFLNISQQLIARNQEAYEVLAK